MVKDGSARFCVHVSGAKQCHTFHYMVMVPKMVEEKAHV